MASLTKDARGRSPFWICCFTASDGRQLKKSTRQRSRKKALEICLALENAEGMARQGTLTEAKARQLVSEVLHRTSGESLSYFTVEEWFDHWLKMKIESKAARTGERYRQIAREFVDSLGGRSKLTIAAITPRDILSFRETRVAKGLVASTVNLDVKIIGAAFNAAFRQGYIPANPCTAIEALPFERPEKHVFAGMHVSALMDAAIAHNENGTGKDWFGLILTAFYSGGRLQDLANLRWQSIDLPNKLISYKTRKTGARIVIPIHPDLESYLLNLSAPDSGEDFVFPKLAGHATSPLSKAFGRIMARAKIKGEIARAANKKGRTVRTLTFHSLRHSFNSAMANAGVAEEVRMKLAGHSTRDVHMKYTHHELEPLRAAIATIPSIGTSRQR